MNMPERDLSLELKIEVWIDSKHAPLPKQSQCVYERPYVLRDMEAKDRVV
jgi:hypothetical protein